ncbi:tyrosine-type recombinase/integrase [Thermodesulfobacteriota bacterium]
MAIMQECPICHKKQKTSNKLCSCGENLDQAKKSQKRIRYWISYYLPDGRKRIESVGKFKDLDPYSITDAKDALSMRMVQKRERPKLFKTQPEGVMTFNQLTEWFLPFEKDRAAAGEITEDYLKRKEINLNTFNAEFGGMVVNAIQSQDLNRYKAIRKTAGKSDSYIDQEIGAAKSMINTAFDNRKVGGETIRIFKSCKKLLKKGANRRDTVLTYPEYQNLYAAVPNHLKAIVATAFWTGMRRGEILKLTWDKVDLPNRMIRLRPEDTKERKSKNVPISKTLRAILMQIPGRGDDGPVFRYKEKAVLDIRAKFQKGCKDAGIRYGRKVENGFTFHDMRHTTKTIARKAGVDKNVRMTMFGHSNPDDMDLRYDTVDEEDMIDAIDRVELFLQNSYYSKIVTTK